MLPNHMLRIVAGILAFIPLVLLADKFLFHRLDYDEAPLKTLAFLNPGRSDPDAELLGVGISGDH